MAVKKAIGAESLFNIFFFFTNNDIFHYVLRKSEVNATANSSDPTQILVMQVSVAFQVLPLFFLSQ